MGQFSLLSLKDYNRIGKRFSLKYVFHMKIILYIGHHKVGSTALQIFLAQNWLKLAQSGILYPSVESRSFSHALGLALQGQDQKVSSDMNIREPHSALAYRMMSDVSDRKVPMQFKALPSSPQMFNALRNQIDKINPKAVILCSEAFANFGQVDPTLISRLCDLFPESEFEVYCALRRPDDYLISWHGQRLKAGEQLLALQNGGAELYYNSIHFDYRMVVEPWAKQVPNVQLILRNYSDVLAAGGSTEDFCTQISLDMPAGMKAAGRANTSLPRASLELIRQANLTLEPAHAHRLSRYLLNNNHRLLLPRNQDVEMFGARLRAKLSDHFTPTHRYLSKLTSQDAFFPDIDQMRSPRPLSLADASAALLAEMDSAQLPNDPLRRFVEQMQRNMAT